MMRYITILCLLLVAGNSYSQDWKCFRADRESYFTREGTYPKDMKAIRFDSTVITANSEQFFFFNTIRSTGDFTSCFTRFGDSWMGPSMTCYPDGRNCFINHYAGSITISTKAGLNTSWNMVYWPSGLLVSATITSWGVVSVLGVMDSVKDISLQVKDVSGNNVNHPVNNYSVRISKEHGLLSCPNFDIFPDSEGYFWQIPPNETLEQYTFCGMSNPDAGLTNLDCLQVFDFNPGEEFHTRSIDAWSMPPPSRFDTVYTIRKILQRINYPGNDSVSYLVHRMQKHIRYENGNLVVDSHIHDTILETYSKLSPTGNFLDKLPDEVYFDANLGPTEVYCPKMQLRADGRREKISPSYYGRFVNNGIDTCLTQPIFDFCTGDAYYIEGLGGPFGYCDFFENGQSSELLYYHKGNLSWGVPLDPGVILGSGKGINNSGQISVFPSPTNGTIYVQCESGIRFPLKFELYDLPGSKVYSIDIHDASASLTLPVQSGLYIYVISDQVEIKKVNKLLVK